MVDEDAADLQFPKGKNLLSIVFRLDQILVARQLNNFEINRNLSWAEYVCVYFPVLLEDNPFLISTH